MLEVEKFEPPAEFRERALWSDPAIYEEAAADPEAWWLRQATELLDWDIEPSAGPERLQPALLQVVRGRAAERLAPTASTATSRPGTASASPTTGAARRARSATSPTPTCTATSSASPTRSRTSASRRATWSGSTCR